MDELQALQQQLEEARDEAELNLLQLQQVQEELEFYFLRCQELDQTISALQEAAAATPAAIASAGSTEQVKPPADPNELAALRAQLSAALSELHLLQAQRHEEQRLLSTAQTMLEGQARYLEDVSLREEQAAQAMDRLRLLEAEILYYIRNSQPQPNLDRQRISRLIELARQPAG